MYLHEDARKELRWLCDGRYNGHELEFNVK